MNTRYEVHYSYPLKNGEEKDIILCWCKTPEVAMHRITEMKKKPGRARNFRVLDTMSLIPKELRSGGQRYGCIYEERTRS